MDVENIKEARELVEKTAPDVVKRFDLHIEAMGGLRIRIHAYKAQKNSKKGHQPRLPGM